MFGSGLSRSGGRPAACAPCCGDVVRGADMGKLRNSHSGSSVAVAGVAGVGRAVVFISVAYAISLVAGVFPVFGLVGVRLCAPFCGVAGGGVFVGVFVGAFVGAATWA